MRRHPSPSGHSLEQAGDILGASEPTPVQSLFRALSSMLACHRQSHVGTSVYDSYGERVSLNACARGEEWCASSLQTIEGEPDEWLLALQTAKGCDVSNDFVVERVGPDNLVLILTAGRRTARSPAAPGGTAPLARAAASGGAAHTVVVPRGQRALTDAEEAEVEEKLSHLGNPSEKLVEFQCIPVTRHSMRTLRPLTWLNDEVINLFFKLLLAREVRKDADADTDTLRCHFMMTNFYTKLAEQSKGYCYADVRRWTKKTDIFNMHLVIVPIHCHGNHWTLAVVNFKWRRFEYYDSNGRPNTTPGMVLVNLVTEVGLDGSPVRGFMGPTFSHGPCVTPHGRPASASAAGSRTSTRTRRRGCRTTPLSGLRSCGSPARRRSSATALTAASS